MLFILLVLCYFSVFYYKEYLNRRKSPPGPWPIPILGTLLHIAKAARQPHLALAKIASQYKSDITRHKFGSQETIVLSSYKSITGVLTNSEALGRPMVGLLFDRSDGKRLGFVCREGKSWEKNRNWTFKTLKDFGFGKSQAVEKITLELVDEFLTRLKERIPSGQGIFDVEGAFAVFLFKIVWKMVAGRCTSEDDKVIARLLEKNEKLFKNGTFGAGISSVFPWFKWIFPNWTGYNVQMDFHLDCHKAGLELLREVKSNMHGVSRKAKNLTEAYVLKMGDDPEDFNEPDFELLFMDILQGASETTSSFLEACMLFMVLNPDVQSNIYKEIQKILRGHDATVSDLKRMTYLQAVFLEVHRYTKVIPLFMPRRATKDFLYKNYLIKKDSQILTDLHTTFNDKRFGMDPETFRPERFIGVDGQLNESHKFIIPFSVGRRNCPGESLAEMTSFLFFVNILKNYELSIVPGQRPPLAELNVGFSSRPFPFQMWVRTRE